MLANERFKQLQEIVNSSTREELIWINGYLSGIMADVERKVNNGVNNNHAVSVKKITLAFGTETGNSKRLATQLAAVAKKAGVNAKLTGLDQYRLSDIEKEDYFIIIISTQGEGDPPTGAKKFYDFIHDQKGLTLSNMRYAVLALGDSSYPQFCKTGMDVDTQLHKLGGRRLLPLQKCDVDYEDQAGEWFSNLLSKLGEQKTLSPDQLPTQPTAKKQARKYYQGKITTNINLNDRGSNKQTFHIEIETEEPVEYEAGDAFAIIPVNKKIIVDHIIKLTGADTDEIVETTRKSDTIRSLLTNHLNICYLLSSAVKKYAAISGHEIPDVRMDLVDLLNIYPLKDNKLFPEVLKILSPIAPRLYSISSSPAAHGHQEIHLTVSRNSFRVKEEQRYGLCSDFLGELPVGTSIEFYIHKNRAFRLPSPDSDIIMIGPGTGVAPFRAFLAERDATGAPGKNWFFFGEQHFISDFLYQTELQQYVSTGVLNRLDLAFSRDQEEKIYVQNRMNENSKELFNWLENGAFFYVSGTKDPMSRDVESMLVEIIKKEGNKSEEEAKKYLDNLKDSGRYHKDVY